MRSSPLPDPPTVLPPPQLHDGLHVQVAKPGQLLVLARQDFWQFVHKRPILEGGAGFCAGRGRCGRSVLCDPVLRLAAPGLLRVVVLDPLALLDGHQHEGGQDDAAEDGDAGTGKTSVPPSAPGNIL